MASDIVFFGGSLAYWRAASLLDYWAAMLPFGVSGTFGGIIIILDLVVNRGMARERSP
jgi:hypothetical protein